jgi:hypothetical protein
MIVIAIIAVLAALTTAGVGRIRDMGRRAQAINDISQLNTAATSFKNKMNTLPPSFIAMPTMVPPHTGAQPLASMQDDGYRLLLRMFPRWQIQVSGQPQPISAALAMQSMGGQTFTQPGTTFGLRFGAHNNLQNIGGLILDGNQCMAFFLGGPNQQGFDPSGPYPPNGNTKLGPWFDFQDARFTTNNGNNLPWYADPWGQPYAFFSCGTSDNYATTITTVGGTVVGPLQFPLPAAAGGPTTGTLTNSKGVDTGTAVMPIKSGTSGRWMNASGVQIISAGPNGAARKAPMGFGPGGANWSPGVGSYGPESPGEDDLANFNNGAQLGSSGQ